MARDANGKPIGTFKCRSCGELWDGSQLYRDPTARAEIWTCGNLLCGISVIKLTDVPWNPTDIGCMEALIAYLERGQGGSDEGHQKQ